MKPVPSTLLFAGLAALGAAALGALGLVAWWFGFWREASFGSGWIPMAPNTAMLLVLLGLAQAARARWLESQVVGITSSIVATFAFIASALVLAHPSYFAELSWDRWLPAQRIDAAAISIGRMSPLTASAFILSSIAILFQRIHAEGRSWVRWLSGITSAASLSIALAVTIGYFSGTPLNYGTVTKPMALPTALALTALNASLLLVGLRNELRRIWSFRQTATPFPESNRAFRRRIVVIAAAVFGVITLVGFYSLRREQTEARTAVYAQLDAIANLKKEGIVAWRRERISDAQFLLRTAAVRQDLVDLAAQPQDRAARARVLGWLEPLRGELRYDSILVFDPRAKLLLSTPEVSSEGPSLPPPESFAKALASEDVIFGDFYRAGTTESIHLDLLVPIRPLPPSADPVAVVVLRLDPRQYLFPLVQSWPLPNETGESLLLRFQGDEVLSLNELRYESDAALKKHHPISTALRAVADGAVNEASVHEGFDYRHTAVLSSIRKIPDSSWILVAKVDQSEAYANSSRDAWQGNAMLAFLLLTVVLAAAVVWRHRDAKLFQRALIAEQERNTATERLAMVTRHANDIILFMDESGRILEANDRALAAYGYSPDELRALPPGGLRSKTTVSPVAHQLELFQSSAGAIFETVHRRRDGSEFPVEVSCRVIRIGDRQHVLGIYRDISERKRLNRQIASQEARFRFIFENAPVGISLTSDEGCELVNQEHARISGVSVEDSQKPDAFALATHPADYARQKEAAAKWLKGEVDHYTVEKRYLHPDGTVVWAQLASQYFTDPITKKKKAVTTLVDITDRKAHQQEIERLNRMYLAISHVNQALVQMKTQAQLFSEVCRGLVEFGGFQIAWIGWLDPVTQVLNPVAIAGDKLGYVAGIRVSTDPSAPENRGPIGTALRENRTFVCSDFSSDPSTEPWREAAARSKIRSSIALPLRRDGTIVGLLTVYAATYAAFGAKEIAMLEETTGDVSFGITVFAAEARRQEAEAALRANEGRLQFLLSATPAVIYALRAFGDFGTIFISRNVREMLGYEPEAFITDSRFWEKHLHPEDALAATTAFNVNASSGAIVREYRFRRSDGSYRWMHDEMRLVRDAEGRPQEFVGYWFDITKRKEAEESHRASQELVEGIINTIPVGVFWKDRNLTYLGCNAIFANDAGYSNPKDVIGKDDFQMGWKDLAESYRNDDRTVIEKGCAKMHFEEPLATPDGNIRTLVTSKLPMRNAKGEVIGVLGTYLDITSRKQAEDSLRKLSRIVEQAPLSVVITDLIGTIEYANPKFCAVTGYALNEVLGQNPRILKSGETPPESYRDMWQTIKRGNVWSGELRNRKKTGEIFLENAVIAPVADATGRVTHYVALKDDVTVQKRFETETAAMLAKEREVSEMKTRFISVTSHEFRTPMAAAMGSIEILSNHFDRLLPTKRQELLGRITNSLHRMTDMLDDVLTLNRMDAHRTEVRPVAVDLWQFGQHVIEEILLGDSGAHRIGLETFGDSGGFFTDPNLLHHVLSNLLSNAVRYSPAGTPIAMRLKVDARQAEVTVEDQGIGIPPADRARIFEPFERGSNVGSLKGTGLGLNIVKRMTDLLGGTIAVDSVVGAGSKFTVTIPRLPVSSASS